MLNDQVEIEVFGRKYVVEMEGMSQLEISALANKVDTVMKEISKESKVYDSSKLAVLTAIEFAAKLQLLQSKMEDFEKVEGRKVDGMIVELQKSVDPE